MDEGFPAEADGAEVYDHHGAAAPRGADHVVRSSSAEGRFGRLFRTLPPLRSTDAELGALAVKMVAPAGQASSPEGDNPAIPSGYTYLGQFVDHDITFDPASVLERDNDPDALSTFRTPRFDLDSLYGGGRRQTPFLYDEDDPAKLLVGTNTGPHTDPADLPRNQQGRALIGDPRNDVHVIVAQLHLAFVRFHNAVVDHLRGRFFPGPELEDEARRLTCWHYQWIVLNDFLRRLVGPDVLDEVLVRDPRTGGLRADLRFYSWRRKPWVPVEFSAAAYRFGHSMVRSDYVLNRELEPIAMFSPAMTPHPLQHLGGFRPLPEKWTLDWSFFFPLAPTPPQPSRKIDTHLAPPLHHLPTSVDGPRRSLALLNLLRGRALQLPSGQAVAAAMGTSVPDAELGVGPGETPLYFWLLKEAEVVGEGLRLGPTGGRIVAEVLVGMLEGDPSSFLRKAPAWRPELPAATPGDFTMADLLRFAGVAG